MDHEEWLEQHDRMLADHDRMIAESREAYERMREGHERLERAHERLERDDERTARLLRRAIRAAVQEARNQRQRWRGIDDAITKLAAAQLVTEEKLQRLERLFEQRYGAMAVTSAGRQSR
jgi:hypothetical protein